MSLSTTERKFHRKIGARCFNATWDYLEKKGRTGAGDRQMLHLVHASSYHWSLIGTPRENAIADWQVSRVYAALKEAPLALEFARSCLTLCEESGLDDLLCTAYEAMARAFVAGRDGKSARRYVARARGALDTATVDDEARAVFLGQIRETERMIRAR
ncbi:MAG: hypothetical protein L3J68_03045 [Thermoplasmata archaeon]|jgi:hypothetical protein|nr:hypothetical protein [Thermoplasmata archaeon]